MWTWDPAFNIFSIAAKIYQGHPGFKLDIQETPWDDLQTAHHHQRKSQSWDELPDIFLMQNNAFQKNLNYPELVQPLTDSGIRLGRVPESVKAFSTVDGVNYGVPFDAGTTSPRSDRPDRGGRPHHRRLHRHHLGQVHRAWQAGQGQDQQAMLSGPAGSSDMIMMMLQSAGANLFDDQGSTSSTTRRSTPRSRPTRGSSRRTSSSRSTRGTKYVGEFINGNIAGVINGVWIAGTIQAAEDPGRQVEITNLPKLDGIDGATNFSANGGSSWAS